MNQSDVILLKHQPITAHHVVVVVCAPQVGAAACAEVGLVAFGLVDPLPVEVAPEVDVERTQAAALLGIPEVKKRWKEQQGMFFGEYYFGI